MLETVSSVTFERAWNKVFSQSDDVEQTEDDCNIPNISNISEAVALSEDFGEEVISYNIRLRRGSYNNWLQEDFNDCGHEIESDEHIVESVFPLNMKKK